MENLLPIIIAILYFGYKQYKKSFDNNNNQKETPNTESNEQYHADNKPDNLNDFINSFMGSEEEEVKPASYTNNYVEPSREDYSYSSEMDFTPEEEEEQDEKNLVNTDKPDVIPEINYQESMGEDAVMPKFDLRQAVVYDAVLNPPYINN